ncbi:MAG: hypothetical protein ACI35R_05130 [Bacillus sp. (in: firmicutes)]
MKKSTIAVIAGFVIIIGILLAWVGYAIKDSSPVSKASAGIQTINPAQIDKETIVLPSFNPPTLIHAVYTSNVYSE